MHSSPDRALSCGCKKRLGTRLAWVGVEDYGSLASSVPHTPPSFSVCNNESQGMGLRAVLNFPQHCHSLVYNASN